jgi:CBS-domain-containing membrane protein
MINSLLLPVTRSAVVGLPLRPAPDLPWVKPTDPAYQVMTDFAHERPITTPEDRSIEDALDDMFRFGIRALLVMRDDKVTGLITSYDIQGERALQFMQNSSFTRHDEIQVGYIMTCWRDLPVIDWHAVCDAQVGEILAIFKEVRTTHIVVVEANGLGPMVVRGLISRTRLDRQLRG